MSKKKHRQNLHALETKQQDIKKGDDVAMATKPTVENLYIAGTKQLTGFGREYEYLLQHGYTYDVKTSTMKLKK